MSNDDEGARLAHAEFWDERYAQAADTDGDDSSKKPTHEWFRSYGDLEGFLSKHLFAVRPPATEPRILHLGSGDSTMPLDLAHQGYTSQLCVDFSEVVVDMMSKRHASEPGIVWKRLDVREMGKDGVIGDKSVDVAFDKGTLDAMIHGSPWSPPDEVLENTGRYMREVFRVLKDDGVFLYITYRQPHFVKPLLNCEGTDWESVMEVLGEAGAFGYYGFALTKKRREDTSAAEAS